MGGLKGIRILLTGPEEKSGGLEAILVARGATVLHSPAIALVDPEDWGPADRAIDAIERYDWILFTSSMALEKFLERRGTPAEGKRLRLGRAKLAAIGAATAEAMAAAGLVVDLVAGTARAEGLVEQLLGQGMAGARVLLPRALVARETLPQKLREAGATVDIVPVYRTVSVPLSTEVATSLASGGIDVVILASESAVRSLTGEGVGSLSTGAVLAVIGPVTADALRARGLEPEIVAAHASAEGLAEAIERHFEDIVQDG